MQKVVVYALDIGVYNTGAIGNVLNSTTTAWSRLSQGIENIKDIQYDNNSFIYTPNNRKPVIFECGRSLEQLAEKIAADIKKKHKIALGFEAPMWIPLENLHRANLRLFEPRFEAEKGHAWYLQAGAAATLKAISLGIMLRNHLNLLEDNINCITCIDHWTPGSIILYEAFVAGNYKLENNIGNNRQNEWDAFTAGLAWGSRHCGFHIPDRYIGRTLHNAGRRAAEGLPLLSIWNLIFEECPATSECEVVAIQSEEKNNGKE